jgi:hypothetical protein
MYEEADLREATDMIRLVSIETTPNHVFGRVDSGELVVNGILIDIDLSNLEELFPEDSYALDFKKTVESGKEQAYFLPLCFADHFGVYEADTMERLYNGLILERAQDSKFVRIGIVIQLRKSLVPDGLKEKLTEFSLENCKEKIVLI